MAKDPNNTILASSVASQIKTLKDDFEDFLKDPLLNEEIKNSLDVDSIAGRQSENLDIVITTLLENSKKIAPETNTYFLYLNSLREMYSYLTELERRLNDNRQGDFKKEAEQFQNFKTTYEEFQAVADSVFSFQVEVTKINNYLKNNADDPNFAKNLQAHNKALGTLHYNVTKQADKLLGTLKINMPQKVAAAITAFAYSSLGLAYGVLVGLPLGLGMAIATRKSDPALKGLAAPFRFTKVGAKYAYNFMKSDFVKEQKSIFGAIGKFHAQVTEQTAETKNQTREVLKNASPKK